MSYNFNYKLLLNFEKMMNDYQKHLKNLLMQKMLHAKRISLSGKIINLEPNKIFEYNNIYYINGVLIYKEKLTLKKKKGEFILKLDNNQNIVEAYECLCIEKVLI
jgi:hypothetical protein